MKKSRLEKLVKNRLIDIEAEKFEKHIKSLSVNNNEDKRKLEFLIEAKKVCNREQKKGLSSNITRDVMHKIIKMVANNNLSCDPNTIVECKNVTKKYIVALTNRELLKAYKQEK